MSAPNTITELQRFLLQYEPGEPSVLVTEPELAGVLRREVEADYDAGDAHAALRVWRWAGDGVLQRLHLVCIEPGGFDADDYADTVWAALDANGRPHAEFSLRIDGRS